MKKKICICLVVVLSCFLFGCGSGEKESSASEASAIPTVLPDITPEPQMAKIAVITGADSGLNVRASASTEGQILGLVQNGDKFRLLIGEPQNGWYQVEYKGENAFLFADYVKVEEVTVQEANALDQGSGTASETPAPSAPQTGTETPAPSPTPNPASGFAIRENEDGEA